MFLIGGMGGAIGFVVGILCLMPFFTDPEVHGLLNNINDFLWFAWFVLQGIGFLGLFRRYMLRPAKLAFAVALASAAARLFLMLVFQLMLQLSVAIGSLLVMLLLLSMSILVTGGRILMMVLAGFALIRVRHDTMLQSVYFWSGILYVISGLLAWWPLVSVFAAIPNLLVGVLFFSESGLKESVPRHIC